MYPLRPEDCYLDELVEKEWTITLKVNAWHDPDRIRTEGLPTDDEIQDFFNFFIEQGYMDVWDVAELVEVQTH